MTWWTTACPRNCTSTCGMRVEVVDGRIRRLEPHPQNRATAQGLCLKGLSYVERVRAKDRLLHPQWRRPGSDTFSQIDWTDAIDLMAEKLQRFRSESGAQSVLFYAGSGTKGLLNAVSTDFWRLFGGCTMTYGDLCWPAGLEATRLTLGENKHNAPWDLERARLIVVWGKNPADTNIHQMQFLDRALDRGAKLVVIDPRRTATADRAHLLIQPKPGTDAALALAVAGQLIERGLIDRDFIAQYVHGYERFRQAVRHFSAERAESISGVPAETVRRLAELFGTIKPATLIAGFGMQRFSNGGQTLRCLIALLAITGNIGLPGGGWQYANLQSHIFDPVKDPQACYPISSANDGIRTSVSIARLGRDMLAQKDPKLRMIWVERGNPLTSNPAIPTTRTAFDALEFRVVIDQFMTDTAQHADLVLPAKTLFEQSDAINAYWHPYIQIKQKVLDPPGEVKPETEIYRLLAERLELDKTGIEDKLPGPFDAAIDAYLNRQLARFGGLSLEQLKTAPWIPPHHEPVAFADRVFATPSGKIELGSQQATVLWNVDALPGYTPIAPPENSGAGGAYPLMLLTPNSKNRIHTQFQNLDLIRSVNPEPRVRVSPHDAKSRAVRSGDQVRIFNGHGSIVARAVIDAGLRPGCVSLTNGWWDADGAAVNHLTVGRETDMGHGAAFHDTWVELTPA